MARKHRLPSYTLHKASGQARVRIDGRDIYLGPYDSDESRARYRQLIADFNSKKPIAGSLLTVGALAVRYLKHAEIYYRKNDAITSEVHSIRLALRYLVKFNNNLLAVDLKPSTLIAVRELMIQDGVVRTSINKHIHRIRRMYRWAVEQEIVPPDTLSSLMAVSGLREGRSLAVESEPVQPVSRASVAAVERHVRPVVWAMIQMQLMTGARPGEIRIMRTCDIDRSGDVWEYVPESHKTQHHGRERRIFIGPNGQSFLAPWLKADPQRFLFEATPGNPYTKDSYRRAVSRACLEAGIPEWSPNQLRHTAATEIRRQFGLEASRTVLGHATSDVTEIYAERDFDAARDVIRRIG